MSVSQNSFRWRSFLVNAICLCRLDWLTKHDSPPNGAFDPRQVKSEYGSLPPCTVGRGPIDALLSKICRRQKHSDE